MNKYKWLPSEPTDEMKLAMANAFIASLQVAQEGYDLTNANTCATILGFVFEQAWQAAPGVEKEPAAYSVCNQSGCIIVETKRQAEKLASEYGDGTYKPLYTHPQPNHYIKDHEIAHIVNVLTNTAKEYAQTQQLRESLRRIIEPVLKQHINTNLISKQCKLV